MSFIKKRKHEQGTFNPKFSYKYKGKYPIIVRSSWERLACQWFDANPNIVEWGSEGISIPYYDPVQMKRRRYYPDFLIKVLDKNKNLVKYLIEVKPYKETVPPKKSGKKSKKTILHQEATYLTNQAKFRAAEDYCQRMNINFKILTEKQLFKK